MLLINLPFVLISSNSLRDSELSLAKAVSYLQESASQLNLGGTVTNKLSETQNILSGSGKTRDKFIKTKEKLEFITEYVVTLATQKQKSELIEKPT